MAFSFLSGVRFFWIVYVSLDNVYTVMADDFVGYTPETFTSGIMAWQSPANRTFTGGIQLTF